MTTPMFPTPGLLKNTMRHGDKIEGLVLEITFDIGQGTRKGFTKAHITLEDLSNPAFVRQRMDESIEMFMVQHVRPGFARVIQNAAKRKPPT